MGLSAIVRKHNMINVRVSVEYPMLLDYPDIRWITLATDAWGEHSPSSLADEAELVNLSRLTDWLKGANNFRGYFALVRRAGAAGSPRRVEQVDFGKFACKRGDCVYFLAGRVSH